MGAEKLLGFIFVDNRFFDVLGDFEDKDFVLEHDKLLSGDFIKEPVAARALVVFSDNKPLGIGFFFEFLVDKKMEVKFAGKVQDRLHFIDGPLLDFMKLSFILKTLRKEKLFSALII